MSTNTPLCKDVAYTYNGILLSHKNNERLPFATAKMALEGIALSDMKCKTEKEKYCMISLNVESKEQNQQTKQKQTHGCRGT